MKTVLLVTGHIKQCGIYQYADSMFEILKESNKYNFVFAPVSSIESFNGIVEATNPYAIIYNHHPVTMPWMNSGVTRPLKNLKGIKQILITGHEHINRYTNVDSYVLIDPRSKDEGYTPAIPPIKYYDDIQYSAPAGVIKIGTSGFANNTKNLSKVIELINAQFTDEVILNLHISDGAFIPVSGDPIVEHLKQIANANVKINVTREFMSREQLIRWLNGNDINLYWYESPPVPGVSASINHAIASKKPFGVNDCTLLNHVRRDYNDLTNTSISDIIRVSPVHLNEFYDVWNSKTFLSLYEGLLDGQV